MLARAASTARRRWPFLLIGALTLTSVLFAGLWLGAASATPKRTQAFFSFNDKMTKFSAAESDNQACAPPAWSDIPSSSIGFSLGGTVARHTLINVSVGTFLDVGSAGEVRLLVDGVVQGIGTIHVSNFGTSTWNFSTASYTNLTSALAPGHHMAGLQFISDSGTFCVNHWTYAILHV